MIPNKNAILNFLQHEARRKLDVEDRWPQKRFAGAWVPIFRHDLIITQDMVRQLAPNVTGRIKNQLKTRIFKDNPNGVKAGQFFYPYWDANLTENGLYPLDAKGNTRSIMANYDDPNQPKYIGPGSIFRFVNNEIMVNKSTGRPRTSNPTMIHVNDALSSINTSVGMRGKDAPIHRAFMVTTYNDGIPYMVRDTNILFRPKNPSNTPKMTRIVGGEQSHEGKYTFFSFVHSGFNNVSADDPIFQHYDLIDAESCSKVTTFDPVHQYVIAKSLEQHQPNVKLDPYPQYTTRGGWKPKRPDTTAFDMNSVGSPMHANTWQLTIGPQWAYQYYPPEQNTVYDFDHENQMYARGRQREESVTKLGEEPILRPLTGWQIMVARLNPLHQGGGVARSLESAEGIAQFNSLAAAFQSAIHMTGVNHKDFNEKEGKYNPALKPPFIMMNYSRADHLKPIEEREAFDPNDIVREGAEIAFVDSKGRPLTLDKAKQIISQIKSMEASGKPILMARDNKDYTSTSTTKQVNDPEDIRRFDSDEDPDAYVPPDEAELIEPYEEQSVEDTNKYVPDISTTTAPEPAPINNLVQDTPISAPIAPPEEQSTVSTEPEVKEKRKIRRPKLPMKPKPPESNIAPAAPVPLPASPSQVEPQPQIDEVDPWVSGPSQKTLDRMKKVQPKDMNAPIDIDKLLKEIDNDDDDIFATTIDKLIKIADLADKSGKNKIADLIDQTIIDINAEK